MTERTSISISEFEATIIALEAAGESKNFLFYGDSNAGKTVLSGTAPGKQFWLVGENGWKTAARVAKAGGNGAIISNTALALAAVDWLNHRKRYREFDWIVLDGLSTMERRFRLAYAQEAFDMKGSRTHRNLPDKPDYFNTQNFLTTWIPMLVDMPVNFIITAHPYRTDKTENGELLVFPGIQGKIAEVSNAISGLMDVVGYMEKRRVRLRSGKSTIRRTVYFETPERGKDEEEVRYVCGDKFGVLPDKLVSPTMPKILSIIDGESSE